MDLDEGFSVVIPHFNSTSTLQRTLQSVQCQTVQAFEVIVIDDSSMPDEVETLKVMERTFNFKLILGAVNRGPSYYRNIGNALAGAKNVACIYCSDTWCRKKLETLGPIMTHSAFVFHDYSHDQGFNFKSQPEYELKQLTLKDFIIRNLAQTSCISIVKTSNDVKFDETMRYCEDYDLCLRFLSVDNNKITYLKGCVMTHLGRPQLSVGGLSGNRLRMRLGEYRAYRKLADNYMFSGLAKVLLVFWSIGKHFVSWVKN